MFHLLQFFGIVWRISFHFFIYLVNSSLSFVINFIWKSILCLIWVLLPQLPCHFFLHKYLFHSLISVYVGPVCSGVSWTLPKWVLILPISHPMSLLEHLVPVTFKVIIDGCVCMPFYYLFLAVFFQFFSVQFSCFCFFSYHLMIFFVVCMHFFLSSFCVSVYLGLYMWLPWGLYMLIYNYIYCLK